jgi:membrane glycosyltransferase
MDCVRTWAEQHNSVVVLDAESVPEGFTDMVNF